jgi:hypothetical protein
VLSAQISLSVVRNEFYTSKIDGEDQRERLLGATTMTEGDNGITDGETRGTMSRSLGSANLAQFTLRLGTDDVSRPMSNLVTVGPGFLTCDVQTSPLPVPMPSEEQNNRMCGNKFTTVHKDPQPILGRFYSSW